MAIIDNILSAIGDTPMVELKRISPEGSHVFAKLECLNPSGSIKDRIIKPMIEDAVARGFLKEGHFADIAIVNLTLPDNYSTSHPAYKCGWSPFEGMEFSSTIVHTFVNGEHVVENSALTGKRNAKALEFQKR